MLLINNTADVVDLKVHFSPLQIIINIQMYSTFNGDFWEWGAINIDAWHAPKIHKSRKLEFEQSINWNPFLDPRLRGGKAFSYNLNRHELRIEKIGKKINCITFPAHFLSF